MLKREQAIKTARYFDGEFNAEDFSRVSGATPSASQRWLSVLYLDGLIQRRSKGVYVNALPSAPKVNQDELSSANIFGILECQQELSRQIADFRNVNREAHQKTRSQFWQCVAFMAVIQVVSVIISKAIGA